MRNTFYWACLPAIAALAAPSNAQVSSSLLEEVVVSAQKRNENIQDVGISISAFSGDQLDALGVVDSVDIAAITPGVSLGGAGAGQFPAFTIRGVSQTDFNDYTESPVAVYIDDGYVRSMQGQLFSLFDIERVEVLKGPQGTLFGRNATGGLIHYLTKAPTFEPEAYAEATYGSYNQVRLEGAVSGPLSSSLAARLSVYHNQHDPVFDNQFAGADDEWAENTTAARLRFLYSPKENIDIHVTGFGGQSRLSSSPYRPIATIAEVDESGNLINSYLASPTETREGIGPGGVNTDVGGDFGGPDGILLTRTPGGDFFGFNHPDNANSVNKNFTCDDCNEVDQFGGQVKVEWDLGDVNLTSITDYKEMDKFLFIEVDMTPINQQNVEWAAEQSAFTQEIRFDGSFAKGRWVAGVFYMHSETEVDPYGFAIPPNPDTPLLSFLAPIFGFQDTGIDFFIDVDQEIDSYSAFAQFDYDLSDDVKLTVGLRGIQEEKEFEYLSAEFIDGEEVVVGLVPRREASLDQSETLWTGKLQLDWRATENTLVYAGVNLGAKAGGFNAPLFSGANTPDDELEYDPEEILAYEVGFKRSTDRLTTNFAAFYYDYKDYQGFNFFGVSSEVVNLDSRIWGLDAEVRAGLADGLELILSGAYTDATVYDVELEAGPVDRDTAYTPDLQFNGILRYQWALNGGATASLQGDVRYVGDTWAQLTNFDSTKLDSYTVGNLRASYSPASQQWQLDLFVNNVTDEVYKTISFDTALISGSAPFAFGRPRWAGATIKFTF